MFHDDEAMAEAIRRVATVGTMAVGKAAQVGFPRHVSCGHDDLIAIEAFITERLRMAASLPPVQPGWQIHRSSAEVR